MESRQRRVVRKNSVTCQRFSHFLLENIWNILKIEKLDNGLYQLKSKENLIMLFGNLKFKPLQTMKKSSPCKIFTHNGEWGTHISKTKLSPNVVGWRGIFVNLLSLSSLWFNFHGISNVFLCEKQEQVKIFFQNYLPPNKSPPPLVSSVCSAIHYTIHLHLAILAHFDR